MTRTSIDFLFEPFGYVMVTACEVNYRGRVIECIFDGILRKYLVEYVDDKGDFKRGTFLQDELTARNPT